MMCITFRVNKLYAVVANPTWGTVHYTTLNAGMEIIVDVNVNSISFVRRYSWGSLYK